MSRRPPEPHLRRSKRKSLPHKRFGVKDLATFRRIIGSRAHLRLQTTGNDAQSSKSPPPPGIGLPAPLRHRVESVRDSTQLRGGSSVKWRSPCQEKEIGGPVVRCMEFVRQNRHFSSSATSAAASLALITCVALVERSRLRSPLEVGAREHLRRTVTTMALPLCIGHDQVPILRDSTPEIARSSSVRRRRPNCEDHP